MIWIAIAYAELLGLMKMLDPFIEPTVRFMRKMTLSQSHL